MYYYNKQNSKVNLSPEQFFDFRSKIKVQNLEVAPYHLKALIKDNKLFLQVEGQKSDLFLIPTIFVRKIFRWFYTGTEMVNYLSTEAKEKIINDLLTEIDRRGQNYNNSRVNLRIENDYVYSILAHNYETVEDLKFYEAIKHFGITTVDYDPYITRFRTNVKLETEVKVGDLVGYSLHFTNSQTGFGALSRSVHVLRYICSNGAVTMEKGDTTLFYHNRGGFENFKSSLKDFEEEFNRIAPEFNKKLVKANSIVYGAKLSPKVKSILSPAVSVYDLKEYMFQLGKCKTLWEVYDFLTTESKKLGVYECYLLQEAAGNIINKIVESEEINNEYGASGGYDLPF